jgi:cholesterol oxidase
LTHDSGIPRHRDQETARIAVPDTAAPRRGCATTRKSAGKGVVDPYQRAFGYPGLHVTDGSVMPANPGVNPSPMITALAERAMSLWPNKGDADPRPPLGSGYARQKPIMPRKPIVPKGAPAELRLDAKKDDVIPLYPY